MQRKAVKPWWSRVTALAPGWSRGRCGLEGLPEQTLMESTALEPPHSHPVGTWPHILRQAQLWAVEVSGSEVVGPAPAERPQPESRAHSRGHTGRALCGQLSVRAPGTQARPASPSPSAGPALAHSSPTAVGQEQQVKAGQLIVPGSL